MGRGRAKAKQTKVARELKYNAPKTDLNALEQELSSDVSQENTSWYDDPYADPDEDPYAADPYAAAEGEDEDEGDDRRQ